MISPSSMISYEKHKMHSLVLSQLSKSGKKETQERNVFPEMTDNVYINYINHVEKR